MQELKNELKELNKKLEKSWESKVNFKNDFEKDFLLNKNLFRVSKFHFLKTKYKIEFDVNFLNISINSNPSKLSKRHQDKITVILNLDKKSVSIKNSGCYNNNSPVLPKLSLLKKELRKLGFKFWINSFNFIFDIEKLQKQYYKKIKDIEESIINLEHKNEMKILSDFLSSNKKIIEKDLENFLNNKKESKTFINYDIRGGIIYFNEIKLSVTNNGRKIFNNGFRNISKKEAVRMLESQIFIDNKNITSSQDIPFVNYSHQINKLIMEGA